MAEEENSITRRCNVCKIHKPLEEFPHNRWMKFGRDYICRICKNAKISAYQRTERGAANNRARQAKYSKTKKGKITKKKSDAKYVQTPKGREAKTRSTTKYARTPNGRVNRRETAKRMSELYPEKIAARNAVTHAREHGRIIRPDSCTRCGKVCVPESHHHLGYSVEHRLSIVWLCKDCHILEDKALN